jgi:hypothetical protein
MQRLGALLAWLAVEYLAFHVNALAPRNAWYYPIASIFDVMSISIFLSFRPTQLVVDLAKLTACQLATQALGWGLYMLHFHPTALVYNWSNWATEALILARFAIVGKHDGDIRVPADSRLFYLGAFLGRRQNPGDHA